MKLKIKKIVCIGLILTTLIGMTGCQQASSDEVQTYAWALGTSSPEDTVTQMFAEKFVEEVDRLSDGKMFINIYPNSTIGNDKELLESCQDGDIPFIVQNTAPQVSFMEELAVFDLPVAFETIEEARTAIDNEEFRERLDQIYLDGGYKLLGMADQGFRVMTTNKKIESIEDFDGQKVRTMDNSNHLAFWQAIGTNPTPMAFSEVYIGLQQNTIDAQENPYEVIVSGKLYEQQKYVIQTNHLPHYITLLVSDEFLNSLPQDQQEIILAAAETATNYAREQADVRVQDRLDIMSDNSVEIVELSEQTFNDLRDGSRSVYDSIQEDVGEELVNLYVGEQ